MNNKLGGGRGGGGLGGFGGGSSSGGGSSDSLETQGRKNLPSLNFNNNSVEYNKV